MAVYDSGPPWVECRKLEFTVMALKLYHGESVGEVVVVDNHPLPHSPLPGFCIKVRAKYVPLPEPVGTSPPRNRVFLEATTDFVACIDPHILLAPGTFPALDAFYERHGADCPDLLHGPLISEDCGLLATHMNDQWRAEMWGTWGIMYRTPGGSLFSCQEGSDGFVRYVAMVGGGEQGELSDPAGLGLPLGLPWSGHERVLAAQGIWPAITEPDPFPIPGHGMGFFACRKDAWLPFHEDARGFGGEEMTSGYRYRKAGRQVWCVPEALWWHSFDRSYPGLVGQPAPYPLSRSDRIRNYLLEFERLGLNTNPIREHFFATGPDWPWQQAVASAHLPTPAPPTPAPLPASPVPLTRLWVYDPPTGRGGFFGRRDDFPDGAWIETGYDGSQRFLWQQVGVGANFVELHDPGRGYRIRLSDGRCELATGGNGYGPAPSGRWVVTDAVVVPDLPAAPINVVAPADGPGTELKGLLASIGIEATANCTCNALAAKMNLEGPDWTEEHAEEIATQMRANAGAWGWWDKLAAAARAGLTGLAFKVNWTDPYPGLIHEAVRRWRERNAP
jgi:hypothetical protein